MARNLIGTGADQVSVNGMLGELAFQTKENVNFTGGTGKLSKLDIDAISVQLNVTASNIIVYDTSKDSDGGAWRKRCQHTSWYNETLNTSTRGSRKDFPSVAVIVTTSTAVTIYDGDDVLLPMWMVFSNTANSMIGNTTTLRASSALNAQLHVANDGALWSVYFISDRGDLRNATARYDYKGLISTRNDGKGYTQLQGTTPIQNSICYAVDTYVNAECQVDPTTGLPNPIIAIAHANYGLSVIMSDGTIKKTAHNNNTWWSHTVAFDKAGTLWAAESIDHGYGGLQYSLYPYTTLNGMGIGSQGYPLRSMFYGTYGVNSSYPRLAGGESQWMATCRTDLGIAHGTVQRGTAPIATTGVRNSDGGLSLLIENIADRSTGMVSYITTQYNSGYLPGAIKTCVLSDTVAETIIGAELISNGDFATNSTSGWTAYSSTVSASGNQMTITRSGGSGPVAYYVINTEVGKTYTVSAYINSSGSRGDLLVCAGSGGVATGAQLQQVIGPTQGSSGYVSTSFTATAAQMSIQFAVDSNSTSIVVDNVSCRRGDEDRSWFLKGSQVFGTLTKTPVAPGANLVGYEGWSLSNAMHLPINANYQVGTGDWSLIAWVKFTGANNGNIITIWDADQTTYNGYTQYYQITSPADGTLRVLSPIGAGVTTSLTYNDGAWHHVVGLRRSSTVELYVDGLFIGSIGSQTTNYNTNLWGAIGRFNTSNSGWNGSMTLVRVSATAPTAAQIKTMYQEEKALFRDNAQCTMYGTDNSVRCVAFDDATGLLHVAHTTGRSSFKGLVRADQSSLSVTRVAASNALIAEV